MTSELPQKTSGIIVQKETSGPIRLRLSRFVRSKRNTAAYGASGRVRAARAFVGVALDTWTWTQPWSETGA